MTRVNESSLNHIYQNHINDFRKKSRKTMRRKKRTKSLREPATVESLLSFSIERAQLEDKQRRNTEILRKARLQECNWSLQLVLEGRHELIMKENMLYMPEEHANDVIQWYHEMLRHPGTSRLYKTLNKSYYIKGLKRRVNNHVKTCAICQTYKRKSKNMVNYYLI